METYEIGKRRPQKDYNRELLFSQVKKPVKHYMGLPSLEQNCVSHGITCGIFDDNTHITAIEQNKRVFNALNRLGYYNQLFYGKLEKFSKFNPSAPPVDFAFFDLCGELNHDTASWLKTMMPHWDKNAVIGITLAVPRRVKSSLSHNIMSGKMDDWISCLPKPKYQRTGFVDSDPFVRNMCAVVNEALRFKEITIAKQYRDGNAHMMMISGYRGKTVKPVAPTGYDEYDNFAAYFGKVSKMKTREITSGVKAHLCRRWNALKMHERASWKGHNAHNFGLLEKLGIV